MKEGSVMTRLEQSHMSDNMKSIKCITLDCKQIESITKTLKRHQKELRTRETITRVTFNSRLNELSLITDCEKSSLISEPSYHRPCNVSDNIEDFTATFETVHILKGLLSQKETGQHTIIEYDAKKNHIRLSNESSTMIIIQTK